MYQEAINELCSMMDAFPRCYKIEIIERNYIRAYLTDPSEIKEFNSAIEMLEWLEAN